MTYDARRKLIIFPAELEEKIRAWAERESRPGDPVTFSAAVRTLLWIGLQAEPRECDEP